MHGKDILLFLAFGFLAPGSPTLCEEIFDLRVFDADVEIVGPTAGVRFGKVVAVGDMNGDGIDDILVAQEGSAYVVYGDTALQGLIDLSSSAADLRIDGVGMFSSIRTSPLASFGDFNGDDIDDLIISYEFSYETYLVYGGESLPAVINVATSPGVIAMVPTVNRCCGNPAVAAGDLNGDGFEDAMMARGMFLESAVEVFVVLGADSLPGYIDFEATPPDVHIWQSSTSVNTCPCVCLADLNHDGLDDIIFSSYKYGNCPGALFAIYGDSTLPSWINLDSVAADVAIIGSSNCDYFGTGIGTGDVNGDGFTDLIVGEYWGADGAGITYVLYGDTSLPSFVDLHDTTADVMIYGLDGGHVGNVIATGDFNQDGFTDMLLGHQDAVDDSVAEAFLVFGGENLPAEIHLDSTYNGITISSQRPYDFLGADVAIGDFNGDGLDDLMVGACAQPSVGKAFVIFGSNTINYGDVNYDKSIDIADAVFLLNYLFKSGLQPYPRLAGDANCDEVADVADVVHLLNYLFKSGPEPGCPQ